MKACVPGYITDSTKPSAQLAGEDVAVEVVLPPVTGVLQQHAMGAAGSAGARRAMRSKGSTRWRITHSSQAPKRVSAASSSRLRTLRASTENAAFTGLTNTG
jgi:isopentenyl diphosphate isomerase/L-lactate dehydrogenase-like FMN-dependent dehydrogenase